MIIPKVKRGEVVGIGKLKVFPSAQFPYKIPMLSFLVLKAGADYYVASCIQLHMDGYGNSPDKAMSDMRERCADFLLTNFTHPKYGDKGWDNLHGLFASDADTDELWDAYRTVQLNLAERGVNTDAASFLLNRVAELEKELANLRAAKQKVSACVEAKIVEYKEAA